MSNRSRTLFYCVLLATVWSVGNGVPASGGAHWERVTGAAAWEPRDSQGEVVFRGKMWILGGWRNSEDEGPRDVWSSKDGRNWKLELSQAPWKHADLSLVLAHRNRIWLMGGWHGGRNAFASSSNEVWFSKNGVRWEMAGNAPWAPRLGAAGTVFKGRIWLTGGARRYYDGGQDNLYADVWCSSDGRKWEKVVESAPWPARAYHALVAWQDKLWLIGGGNYQPEYVAYNDVWCSDDGINWTCVTPSAPWASRIWFSAVVYNNKLWMLGGWSNYPSRNYNDVWHTSNGKDWIQHPAAEKWEPRHEHSAFVFNDQIWIAGGNTWPLVNDIWRLTPGNASDNGAGVSSPPK